MISWMIVGVDVWETSCWWIGMLSMPLVELMMKVVVVVE